MGKMVTADLESQNSKDGGANCSSLIATTILHPMVRDLAFWASNKAQKRVFKQAAAFNATIHTAASTQRYMYVLFPRPFWVFSTNQVKDSREANPSPARDNKPLNVSYPQ
jgi:hypothetical protein